jgi:hypothetical protein
MNHAAHRVAGNFPESPAVHSDDMQIVDRMFRGKTSDDIYVEAA